MRAREQPCTLADEILHAEPLSKSAQAGASLQLYSRGSAEMQLTKMSIVGGRRNTSVAGRGQRPDAPARSRRLSSGLCDAPRSIEPRERRGPPRAEVVVRD